MTKMMTYTATLVALQNLELHPANVRANNEEAYSGPSVAALAANIREVGLLQPLLVQATDKRRYGVLAGGRRLAALKLLAGDRKVTGFTGRTLIPCHVVPDDAPATAALSLSENELAAPMSAIDRFEAFTALRETDGLDIAVIAQMFGLSERSVRETLRIGLVHMDIRAALRAGDISLETLKAFAGHPDPAVQIEVFQALSGADPRLEAWQVKRALSDHGVRQGDALGRFVLDEYHAAGGEIAPDLIEADSVLSDPVLVQKILAQKLDDLAEEERDRHGFAWAEHRIDPDWDAFSAYGRVYPQPVELDEATQAKANEATARLDELAEAHEVEEDWDERDRLEAEHAALQGEIDMLTTAFAAEDVSKAGVVVIWQQGAVCFKHGLVRPEDVAPRKPAPASGSGDTGAEAQGLKMSRKLCEDLACERTRAVGLALARDPVTARLYGDWLLVGNVVRTLVCAHSSLRFEPGTRAPALIHDCETLEAVGARFGGVERQLAEHEAGLPLGWLANDPDSEPDGDPNETAFDRFADLTPDQRDRLVAWAVSRTLEPVMADRLHPGARAVIEVMVAPDIRTVWTPDARLFGRLTKPDLLRILRQDLGLGQKADALAGKKKSEIVEKMAALFATPDATLPDAQRAAVASWCPDGMATVVAEDQAQAPVEVEVAAEEGEKQVA